MPALSVLCGGSHQGVAMFRGVDEISNQGCIHDLLGFCEAFLGRYL
jgi:hypothetical protein